jgi:hypothetical protein
MNQTSFPDYQAAASSAVVQRADRRLKEYTQAGKLAGMALFNTLRENIITPYRIYTTDMTFEGAAKMGEAPIYRAQVGDTRKLFQLHRHALGQMASEVKIPTTFVNTLTEGEDWERVELAQLLEERFHKLNFNQRGGGAPRFINLVVGNQVRGFVSRSFKRYLKSGPIFEAFVTACAQFGAMPVEALTSDLAFTLRCVLPYVFELKRNNHIAVGVSCSNSDFGAGTFRISATVMNLQTGVISVVRHAKEEKHVGAAEKDTGNSEVLSDETIEKKLLATQSEVRDVVTSVLHPDHVNELLQQIRASMDKEISWSRFTHYMQGKLTSEELRELSVTLENAQKSCAIADITYDVDQQAIINLWWAASATAEVAKRHIGEKRDELQCAAGHLLSSAFSAGTFTPPRTTL